MIVSLDLETDRGPQPIQLRISDLVIAGWTGRDRAAVDAHIHELTAIGVAAPSRTPVFYRVSESLLSHAESVQVLACDSSGEVEFVLLRDVERLLVGVGSDHTDRKAESIGVALSKQMCPKPLAHAVWEFASVERHWDELILRSYIREGGRQVLYQEGRAAQILPPGDLIRSYSGPNGLPPGTAMFCGTLPAAAGVRWATEFSMELEDPVTHRKIVHRYTIEPLPVVT